MKVIKWKRCCIIGVYSCRSQRKSAECQEYKSKVASTSSDIKSEEEFKRMDIRIQYSKFVLCNSALAFNLGDRYCMNRFITASSNVMLHRLMVLHSQKLISLEFRYTSTIPKTFKVRVVNCNDMCIYGMYVCMYVRMYVQTLFNCFCRHEGQENRE